MKRTGKNDIEKKEGGCKGREEKSRLSGSLVQGARRGEMGQYGLTFYPEKMSTAGASNIKAFSEVQSTLSQTR